MGECKVMVCRVEKVAAGSVGDDALGVAWHPGYEGPDVEFVVGAALGQNPLEVAKDTPALIAGHGVPMLHVPHMLNHALHVRRRLRQSHQRNRWVNVSRRRLRRRHGRHDGRKLNDLGAAAGAKGG